MGRNHCQNPATAAFSRKRAFHSPFHGRKERPAPCPETARTAGRGEPPAAQRAAGFLLLFLAHGGFLPNPWRTVPVWLAGGCYPYPRCKGGTQGAHGADRVLLCQCFGCNCQGLPMLWGALGGFGSSAYCDLRQFSFRRRLFNPVQQVLAFRQLTGEAEQRLTLFRGIQLDRCLEEIPHIVQRFCACGVHR